MAREKRLYTFVEVDDSTPIQKLKIMDQLRVLFNSFTYDPANELKNEDLVTKEYLTLKANLSEFLRKATEPIRKGKRKNVVVNISSHFNPVFDEVIHSREIMDYYKVYVARPKVEYNIDYDILVKLVVKKS